MRFPEALDRYARFLKSERNMAPRTVAAYRYDLERFHRWMEECGIGENHLGGLTAWQLKEFLATLHEERDLKPASLARIVSSLRMFFDFLQTEGLVEGNPAKGLRTPKKGRKLPVYLPPAEARQILRAVDPEHPDCLRDRTILTVLVMTGLRLSELVGLDRHDADLEGGVLKVLGKGRKERLVPLNRAAASVLEKWLREGPSPAEGCEALFPGRHGGRISPRSVQYLVMKAVKRAGLDPRVSPHKLRHTFATTLHAEETDLRDIQELLGHTNIASTSIYTHTNVDKVRAAVEKLRINGEG